MVADSGHLSDRRVDDFRRGQAGHYEFPEVEGDASFPIFAVKFQGFVQASSSRLNDCIVVAWPVT